MWGWGGSVPGLHQLVNALRCVRRRVDGNRLEHRPVLFQAWWVVAVDPSDLRLAETSARQHLLLVYRPTVVPHACDEVCEKNDDKEEDHRPQPVHDRPQLVLVAIEQPFDPGDAEKLCEPDEPQ